MAEEQQQPNVSFTLITVWELKITLCADQGGLLGVWAYYFKTEELARSWFDQFAATHAMEDYSIFEAQSKKAMLSNDDQKTLYILERGPVSLTQ